jgi:triacylglycerol lipase
MTPSTRDFPTITPIVHWYRIGSEENPVILVGHSAGAHTCLRLQRLLADDFWGWGSNANWVEAVVSVSGVLNGSTLPYMLGCDKQTGRLRGPLGAFLGNGVQIFAMATAGNIANIYDFDLDQWIGEGHGGNLADIRSALEKSDFAKGEDNLGFDLTLQGGVKANNMTRTEPDTYYFSIVTEQTTQGPFTPCHFPDFLMNPVLAATAAYQGLIVDFDVPPIVGWGAGDLHIDRWRENDGAVSSISQRFPFTAGHHPVGGEGIFDRQPIEKGKWYFEKAEKSTGRSFDHLDVVIGCFSDLTIVSAHKTLYRNIYALLERLP